MKLAKEFITTSNCSYLPNKEQTTHYKIIASCTISECEELIERGFRRFGEMFFRPICTTCHECKTIKIDVLNYNFSKSTRRVLRKAAHIKTHIQKPIMSKEHLNLFDKYHKYKQQENGWSYDGVVASHYYNSFVEGCGEFGYEVLYFDEDRLVGVDIIDILQNGISSIYFYYDPNYRAYSLGKLSLYNQIIMAKNMNKQWIHLGYYVKDCPSLAYKGDYKPYLTLQDRPSLSEDYIYTGV